MHAYRTKAISGELTLSEHIDAKWCNLNELLDLDWAEADILIADILVDKITTNN